MSTFTPQSGSRTLVGMVHLAPLPGSPDSRLSLTGVIEAACRDARTLTDAGFDAILVENFGDSPFRSTHVDPHTVACMTAVVRAVRQSVSLPIGVNVLRNDAEAALAIAAVCEAQFIRVNVLIGVYATDQGMIEGRADELLRYRRRIGSDVAIWADVHVKHALPLSSSSIAQAAEETAYRGKADALVVSGIGTGKPTDLNDLQQVRMAVADRPLVVGSGATCANVAALFETADAIIVGTAIKHDGITTAAVDSARARELVTAARAAR